jgi:LysM repeat protein
MRLIFVCCLLFSALHAQDEGKMLRLSYQLSTLDAEMRSLKEAVENQQTRLESMREDISRLIQATKDASGEMTSSLQDRIKTLEKNLEKACSDIKLITNHSNELASFQKKIEKSLNSYDSLLETQEKEIKDLNSALKSIVQVVQKTNNLPKVSSGAYRVKSGDTLEKIAKDCGISLHALKEINNLQSDTIFIGQQLQTSK